MVHISIKAGCEGAEPSGDIRAVWRSFRLRAAQDSQELQTVLLYVPSVLVARTTAKGWPCCPLFVHTRPFSADCQGTCSTTVPVRH